MVGGGDGNANKERLMINIGRKKVKDGGGGGQLQKREGDNQ